ncbi:MAG: hypothetical protein DMF64_04835 [Acidobacteria bacterium]|nr:MAG: hypothetical protein DMF64_04835 [Acidobacteriota bacterium]
MAVSEELEQSLRAEIERYISERLSNQQAEILRVQSEINQALTRLAEQLTGETSADAPISVAITDYLRRAHAEGTAVASQQSAPARATSDMALLKAAVDEIEEQRTQSDVLNALVNRAASFAPRIAFFVIKNERATGWRARGLEGTVGDDGVREISLPLSEQTILSEVAHARTPWSGTPGTNKGDHELLQKLGGEPPQRMVAIPLVARERAVAVLYADSAALEPDAVNLEALETLVRVTGMAVELLASRRTTAAHPAEHTAAQAAAQPAPQPVEQAAPVVSEPAPVAAEPTVEPQPAARPEQPAVAHVESAPTAHEEVAPTTYEEAAPPVYEAPAPVEAEAPALVSPVETTTPPTAEQAFASPAHPTAAPQEERGIAPFAPPTSAPTPAPTGEATATPLGTTRRYGQEVELPIEVGDDERRFHNDARRFARLLVSEIKLYNEQKVRDGREHGDIYERLREEIDRSRQMYDKRADPRVTARYDYFHHELVNTLAEGNPDKLGREYPGAQVAA